MRDQLEGRRNPFDYDRRDINPFRIRFTLYGFIPIAVPERIVERLGNLITTAQYSEATQELELSKSIEHEIRVEGWLIGPLKKVWKILLQQTRNIQGGVESKYTQSLLSNKSDPLRLFGKALQNLPMPFITDMSVEFDMLIKSLVFTHDNDVIDSYRFTMTLKKALRAGSTFKTLFKNISINAGIAAVAIGISLGASFIPLPGLSSYKSIEDPNADLNGGWWILLIPESDPTARGVAETATIPSGMEKDEDYRGVTTIGIGFDTDKEWYYMPIEENSQFPQNWMMEAIGYTENYIMQLQIIPLEETKYLKLKVTKESTSEVLFSQRVESGVTYKIDSDRNEDGEVFYRLWFGFTNIDLKMTKYHPKGDKTKIEGVVNFNTS